MTQFIGAAQPQAILRGDDPSGLDATLHGNGDLFVGCLYEQQATHDEIGSFDSPYSHCAFLLGQDEWLPLRDRDVSWGESWYAGGASGRFSFVNVSRDAYGSPVGGVSIKCFRSATHELTAAVTSDANGFYIVTTPYYEAHYLVGHKAGYPGVSGASSDTLVPS